MERKAGAAGCGEDTTVTGDETPAMENTVVLDGITIGGTMGNASGCAGTRGAGASGDTWPDMGDVARGKFVAIGNSAGECVGGSDTLRPRGNPSAS